MKKLLAALALLLALVMMISLVSCGATNQTGKDKDNTVDNNGDTNNNNNNNNTDNNTDNNNDNSNNNNDNNNNNNDNNNNNNNNNNPPVTPPEEIVFEDRNEVVYALSPLFVYKDLGFEPADRVGPGLTAGEGATRIGYHQTYSKILYDHDGDPETDAIEAYVSTKYVTTENISDADFTVLETPDTYYCCAKTGEWLYPLPYGSVESAIVYIKRGEQVKRISYSETWTKVIYTSVDEDGAEKTQTGYIYSSVISATDPITTKTFEKDGMSITLGKDFKETTYEGVTAAYETEKMFVFTMKATSEASEDMTAEDFANAIIEAGEISAEVKTEDGLTYFVYNEVAEDVDITVFEAVCKNGSDVWVVCFQTLTADYETLKADIVDYAKSVAFPTVAE